MTAEVTVVGVSRLDDHVLLADAGLAMLGGAAHRLSGAGRISPGTASGWFWRAARLAAPGTALAVPARVVFGDVEAELLELGDQFAESAVAVEPGAVVGELLVGQDAGGGPAVSCGSTGGRGQDVQVARTAPAGQDQKGRASSGNIG
jgi:hypothetical protein